MVRDYKNKEQRKQVWEDIDTEIGPPTGNFSSPEESPIITHGL